MPVISALVSKAIEGLPLDQYRLKPALVDRKGNNYVEIWPTNPRAARIMILNEHEGEYALTLGRGTILEIPLTGKTATGLSPDDEFIEVCKAVIGGGLTERIVTLCGTDLLIVGRLRLLDMTVRSVSGVPLPYPFWRKVRYEPY